MLDKVKVGVRVSNLTTVDHQAIDIQVEKFNLLLDDNADDFLTRSLMADYYLDKGDYISEQCLRWQADNRKRPLDADHIEHELWQLDADHIEHELWQWYRDDRSGSSGYDKESNLPRILFGALDRYIYDTLYRNRAYTSRRSAEEALLKAWRDIGGVI